MSLIQFEDMYEICCEMMNEEKKGVNVKPPNERLELPKESTPVGDHWWEDALQEILIKEETSETEETEVLVV